MMPPYPIHKLILLFAASLLLIGIADASYLQVQNGTTVQAINTTLNTTATSTYSIGYSFNPVVDTYGWHNFSIEFRETAGGGAYVQIYKNGVAMGAEKVTTSSVWSTVYDLNYSFLNTTDTISFWLKCTGGSCEFKNATISYDYVPTPTITNPVNNSAQTSRTVNATWTGTAPFQYQVSQASDFSTLLYNATTSNNFTGDLTLPTGLNYIRVRGYNATEDSITNWSVNQVHILNALIGGSSWNWKTDSNISFYNITWDKGDNNLLVGLLDSNMNSSTDNFNDNDHDWETQYPSDVSVSGGLFTLYNSSSTDYKAAVSNVNLTTFDVTAGFKVLNIANLNRHGFATHLTDYNTATRTYWSYVLYYPAPNKTYFLYYNSGSQTALNNSANDVLVNNTWYMMRMQAYGADGVNKRGKWWLYGQPEPADWENVQSDSTLKYGKIGLSVFYGALSTNQLQVEDFWVKNLDGSGNRIDIGNMTYSIDLPINQTLKSIYTNITDKTGSQGNVSVYVNTSSDNVTWSGDTLVVANLTSKQLYTVPVGNQKRYAKITYQIYSNGSLQSSSDSRVVDFGYTNSIVAPNITSWGNDFTDTSATNISVYQNTNVTFNITSNQTLTYFDWTGATNLTGLTAYKVFDTVGSHTVSMYGSNENGSTQTITWNVTVLDAPTINFTGSSAINGSQTWHTNYTNITVNSNTNLTSVNLTWIDRIPRLHPNQVYSMTQGTNTSYYHNITNLNDGLYTFNVNATTELGTYIENTSWVEINMTLPPTWNTMYLLQGNASGDYKTSNSSSGEAGYPLYEAEWVGWNTTQSDFVQIYRCYDGATGIYRDDTACLGGETSLNLTKVLPVYDVHLVPLNRYKNASGYFVTLADRVNIPDGYSFNTTLGYAMRQIGHQEDIIYINNSVIEVGFDTKFAGTLVYLAYMTGDYAGVNVVNNYDTGRQFTSDYYEEAGNKTGEYGCYSWNGSTTYYLDCWNEVFAPRYPGFNGTISFYRFNNWNPNHGGSKQHNPGIVLSSTIGTDNVTFVSQLALWNSYGNSGDGNSALSDLIATTTYSFDGTEPAIIMNTVYNHTGSHDHAGNMTSTYNNHNIATAITNKPYSDHFYYNGTVVHWGGNTTKVALTAMFVGSLLPAEQWGIGVWNWKSPQFWASNGSLDPDPDNGTYGQGYNAYSMQAIGEGIMAHGTTGYSRVDTGIFYVGNLTNMTTYFETQDSVTYWGNASLVNARVAERNITIEVYSMSSIINSTLVWTNSTGTFYFPMVMDNSTGRNLNYSFTDLPDYNYTYYVTTNFTVLTNYTSETIFTYVDLTTPPASITGLANTTTTTSINWTWADPTDPDFDHVEVYFEGVFDSNVGAGIQSFLVESLSPSTSYTISTRTVDTLGNINATWVNQTTVTDASLLRLIRRIIIID